jgi:hypothetical protein
MELADRARAAFMAIDLVLPEGSHSWHFAGATTMPDLTTPVLLDAAIAWLEHLYAKEPA